MPSLSTSISLALAAKLKVLFETGPDKFLSFPIGLAYPTSFFSFMQPDGGLSAQDQHNYKVEFARLSNMLPKDAAAFPQDASRLLWDVYAQTLTDSVFADSSLNPTQNAQLDQVIDFLTDKQTVDGVEVTVPSAMVQTFYQYKTIYDDINRQYLDEKLTVQFAASDEEGMRLREAWASFKEKSWLDQLKKAEEDWINLGQRDTVRHYQAVRADLEPKRFPHQFKTACLSDLELGELPDLNANGVKAGYATFFSPNNVFQAATPWPSLTLSKAEILSLAAQAPADLSARFGNGQADDTIERLSFEYNKVVMVRPWLNASFFAARSWKLPNNALLSDGNVPRNGLLPAYTSSLILVRNIRVTRRRTATAAQPLVIPILSKVQMGTFVAKYQSPPIVAKPRPEVMMQPDVLHRLQPMASVGRVNEPTQAEEAVSADPAMDPTVMRHMQVQQVAYLRSTIMAPVGRVGPVVRPVPHRPIETRPRPIPPPQPQTIEEKFDFDGVVIIAFECTRLPKSPDPDLSLPWTTP